MKRILVTGATGYIGGRLVPMLLERGHKLRLLVRDARRLCDKPWVDQVEVLEGDVLDSKSVERALDGMEMA